MIQSVTSVGKITADIVSEDTMREVLASEEPKRLTVERKLARWENAWPWFIVGCLAAFVGGLLTGLNM